MKRILFAVLLMVLSGMPLLAQQDILKSSTGYPLTFMMIDSSDHITAKTGLSPTVTISKAGASFASPAGAVSELSVGWYKVAGNATDTNTDGELILHATAAGADPTDIKVGVVVEFDPRNAPTIQNLVDGVLNELTSAHTTAGTVGKKIGATPDATAGAAGGIAIAGSNAATTFATLTSTGALSINGTPMVSQTGDSYSRLGAPSGASIDADIRGVRGVPKSTAFDWAKQFKTSAGVLVTTGTPACTRSIDSVSAFAAGTLTTTAVTSNGLSKISFGTGDMNVS